MERYSIYELFMFSVFCEVRRVVYIFEFRDFVFLFVIVFESYVYRIFGYIVSFIVFYRFNGIDSICYDVFFIEFFVGGLFVFL